LGPWGFFELGGGLALGSLGDLYSSPGLGGWLSLSGGWGANAGRLRIRPALQFAIGLFGPPQSETGQLLSWTPVGLTLSAVDLLDEALTGPVGIRLTPMVGLTIPTSAAPGGFVLTTISLGIQIERRFGPIELALRARAGKPVVVASSGLTSVSRGDGTSIVLCRNAESICSGPPAAPTWVLADSFLAEGWIVESLSAGFELSWDFAWRTSVADTRDGYSSTTLDSNGNPVTQTGPRVFTSVTSGSRFFVSLAPFKYLGLTLELTNVVRHGGLPQFPFFSAGRGFYPVASVNLWVRTDPAIQRNWLEQ
jgi:hypothetical protein